MKVAVVVWPGLAWCAVTSHYHCLREHETEETTPKGSGVDAPNL